MIRYSNTLALTLALSAPCVFAQVGEQVYKSTCIDCHGSGVAGAPKVGDTAKWKPLLKEPQWQLTAHGYVGVKGMPAQGGNPNLSLEDFSKAVVYMANLSGGKWTDPDAKMLAKTQKEVERRKALIKAKKA